MDQLTVMINERHVPRKMGGKIYDDTFKIILSKEEDEFMLYSLEFDDELEDNRAVKDEKTAITAFLIAKLKRLGLHRGLAWDMFSYTPKKKEKHPLRVIVKAFPEMEARIARDFRSRMPARRNDVSRPWIWKSKIGICLIIVEPVFISDTNTLKHDILLPDELRQIEVQNFKGEAEKTGPNVKAIVKKGRRERSKVTTLKVALEIYPSVRRSPSFFENILLQFCVCSRSHLLPPLLPTPRLLPVPARPTRPTRPTGPTGVTAWKFLNNNAAGLHLPDLKISTPTISNATRTELN